MSGYFSSLQESSFAAQSFASSRPGPVSSQEQGFGAEPYSPGRVFGEESQSHFVENSEAVRSSFEAPSGGDLSLAPEGSFNNEKGRQVNARPGAPEDASQNNDYFVSPEENVPASKVKKKPVQDSGFAEIKEDFSSPQTRIERGIEISSTHIFTDQNSKEPSLQQDQGADAGPSTAPASWQPGKNKALPHEKSETVFPETNVPSGEILHDITVQNLSLQESSRDKSEMKNSSRPFEEFMNGKDDFSGQEFTPPGSQEFSFFQNQSGGSGGEIEKHEQVKAPQIVVHNGGQNTEEAPQITITSFSDAAIRAGQRAKEQARTQESDVSLNIGSVELLIEGAPQVQSIRPKPSAAPAPKAQQSNSRLRRRFVTW